MGCSKISSKKEVYSNTGLPQETRKISNPLHPKEREKEEQMKPKVSRCKTRIKIRVKINNRD